MNGFQEPPLKAYYAVIFTSQRTPGDNGYGETDRRMDELVSEQLGFLGAESVRNESGFGITISYWSSLEAIRNWKKNEAHRAAQEKGREAWYEKYTVRVCKVEREYSFQAE
ncbi:antibiotic biosynthesis monooxygenase [Cohnella sp. CFH 77786]|uniref:antibiotic biosynthesis monooxygenase family protein n=1 Tax=Cohnella sp. CFH 77786 TaxID=2662265 RepID=UPI001C60DEBA|nr:antibiotic biosynthesis monooxygenase [Cohnella sp. CFH 77786]MBW5446402.1 antibiotic biosynthesis monooxygenase [Cohnella sp. CFH 77786]